MATQVKHRRGTNAEIMAGVPAIGELWFNTTDNSIHMGDGVTLGGNKIPTENVIATGSTEPRKVKDRFADIINVKDYGAKGDGVTDDTSSIQGILDGLISSGEGAVLYFPKGTYLVSSLNMRGAKNVILLGVCSQYSYDAFVNFFGRGSVIKVTGSGVGVEMSQDAGTISSEAFQCGIKNLTIDGNGVCQRGVVLNGACWIEHSTITNTTDFGVVFTDYTNSASLYSVGISRNLGSGLWIKGTKTTVFNVVNTDLRQNQGYGLILHNGSNGKFDTMVVEANYQGGILLYKPATSGLWQNMVFDNCHIEANGRLESLDPDYTGNYQLVIDAADTNPGNYGSTPFRITFKRCLWSTIGNDDPGTPEKQFFNIQSCNGVVFDDENVYSDGDVTTLSDLGSVTQPWNISFGQQYDSINFPVLLANSVYGTELRRNKPTSTLKPGIQVKGGMLYGEGGRLITYKYKLTDADLPTAGSSVNPVTIDGLPSHAVFDTGSVIGVSVTLVANSGTTAGTLTTTVGYRTTPFSGQIDFAGASVDVTNAQTAASEQFPVESFGFNNASTNRYLSVRVDASADFLPGTGVTMVIEIHTQQ